MQLCRFFQRSKRGARVAHILRSTHAVPGQGEVPKFSRGVCLSLSPRIHSMRVVQRRHCYGLTLLFMAELISIADCSSFGMLSRAGGDVWNWPANQPATTVMRFSVSVPAPHTAFQDLPTSLVKMPSCCMNHAD